MPEDIKSADVEKILADEKAIEDRKQALIADLLKQREAAIKAFDEKLARLGYRAPDSSGQPKKSHHKKAAPPGDAAPKAAAKTKA